MGRRYSGQGEEMTRDEILAMPAGRELDLLIHRKVMQAEENAAASLLDGFPIGLPHYSTDISAAWQLVEKFKEIDLANSPDGTFWVCTLGNNGKDYFTCSKTN